MAVAGFQVRQGWRYTTADLNALYNVTFTVAFRERDWVTIEDVVLVLKTGLGGQVAREIRRQGTERYMRSRWDRDVKKCEVVGSPHTAKLHSIEERLERLLND